jgi:glycosyltransferase involved in cell wall biosynthesis
VRVLQIVTDTDRRGAQVFAVTLGGALTTAGAVVDTVALAPGEVGGLDLAVLGATRLGVTTLRALRRRARKCDVVVAHGSSTLPACAIATQGTGVPFVYRQISDSRFWARTGARRMRVRAGLGRAARVVALWSGAAETLTVEFGVPASKLRVVPNAVDPAGFAPADDRERAAARHAFGLDPGRPTAGFVGALVREKGADVAIDALAHIDELQLLVAGDGDQRGALQERAARVSPGRVVFAGSVGRARDAYAAVDVVTLPSRGGDSMPAALIEAGLMAIPAVATPVEAVPEIVVPDVTGCIVRGDDPDALAAGLSTLLTDDERRARYGTAAREHCTANFTIAPIAQRWLEVLREVT